MNRTERLLRFILVAVAAFDLVALTADSAHADSPPVTGSCHVSPSVGNLERSAHFYHDLLGLELAPSAVRDAAWLTDPGLLRLHGLDRGRLRVLSLRIGGQRCGLELVEFDRVERSPVHRRYKDPGSVALVFVVRDIEAAFAPLANAGVSVVSAGGAPIQMTPTGKNRAVTLEDPDGNFVELAQLDPPPATDAPQGSNVIELRLRITVPNLEHAASVYRRTLGIEGPLSEFAALPPVMRMTGLPESGETRWVIATIPGSAQLLEFMEFRGVGPTRSIHSRIQDPGSTRLQLTVRGVGPLLRVLQGAGFRAISTAGEPVAKTLAGQPWRVAAVEDPFNLFLILQQPTAAQ